MNCLYYDFISFQDKLEVLKTIDLSKKEIRILEIAPNETSESNREDSGTAGTYDGRSSFDSFEIVSNPDLSPVFFSRKKSPSVQVNKGFSPEPEKRKLTGVTSPEGSPMLKKRRKLRSKSVEKTTDNLRYELFEKNIQKVIKKIKKGRIEDRTSSK